ncbi:helix-turn-helix domain-containing protein [Azospira sp. APE16]|jgi:transcriptional regulator with XRE-family HTH domain|uniref:helix-turn-helix domain-containing protein n=1 Tax=Azospira sp. APE16 TaxID=3394231 RepID=UPI003A4DF23B
MTPAEIIDKAKEATGARSYYDLAHKLEVSEQAISSYRKGERTPDFYACTKLAISLGMDPAQLMAEFELQKEKNEKKRAFYRDFLQRAKRAAVITLVCGCIGFYWSGLAASGGPDQAAKVAAALAASAAFFRFRKLA